MGSAGTVAKLLTEFDDLSRRAEELMARAPLDSAEAEELGRAFAAMEANLRYVDYEPLASPAATTRLKTLRRQLSSLRERAAPFLPRSPQQSVAEPQIELARKFQQLDGLIAANRNINDANVIAADIGLQLEKDLQTFLANRVTLKLLNTDLVISGDIMQAIKAQRKQTELIFRASLAFPLLLLLLFLVLKAIKALLR